MNDASNSTEMEVDSHRATDKWRHPIEKKLNDIEFMETRDILMTATLEKDTISCESQSIEMAQHKLRLAHTAQQINKNGLRSMAISRAIQHLRSSEDERAKNGKLEELLSKLSQLDQILDCLNEKEAESARELSELEKKQSETIQLCTLKKAALENKENNAVNIRVPTRNIEISDRLSRLISRMEILKTLQGRLLGSCTGYDWVNDADKIEKYQESARAMPYKAADFAPK